MHGTLTPPTPPRRSQAGRLRDWLDDRRIALIANERFRRWAARFPFTRPMARREARALFDLAAGFVYAQVLGACVQLGVFETLREGPMALPELAARLQLAPEAAQRLVTAAVGLRLLARRSGGAVALGSLGAAMIDNPGVSAMVAHHGHLYADLADPVGLLRGVTAEGGKGGRLAGYWPYAGAEAPGALDAEAVGTYSALMAASQPMVAAEVLDAYDFTRHRCLLDVGGGEGAFLQAVAGQAPGLQLRLFDLPAVAARATARFAAAGLAARATATGGDFRADALPQGADIISLVRVAHDHDDATVLALLKACRAALPKGAMLLLAEPMAETEGAETVGAYFAFYLLAMGQGAASRMGRPRSAAELQAMLAQSGFARARLCATATPLVTRVMVAEAE